MSIPPGQPPGSGGPQYGPPQQFSASAAKHRWPRPHPVWSALIVIVGLLIIIGATANNKPTKVSNTTADAAPHSGRERPRSLLWQHQRQSLPRHRLPYQRLHSPLRRQRQQHRVTRSAMRERVMNRVNTAAMMIRA
jgi:hypothetical protein